VVLVRYCGMVFVLEMRELLRERVVLIPCGRRAAGLHVGDGSGLGLVIPRAVICGL
jgi:hypothetical protein